MNESFFFFGWGVKLYVVQMFTLSTRAEVESPCKCSRNMAQALIKLRFLISKKLIERFIFVEKGNGSNEACICRYPALLLFLFSEPFHCFFLFPFLLIVAVDFPLAIIILLFIYFPSHLLFDMTNSLRLHLLLNSTFPNIHFARSVN